MIIIRFEKEGNLTDALDCIKVKTKCDISLIYMNNGDIVGVLNSDHININEIANIDGVSEINSTNLPYPLVSRNYQKVNTLITVGTVKVGESNLTIIAGPCAVESRLQILETAHAVREAGAHMLRGGAFKPRSSPYSFQGLGEKGLQYLADARDQTGLPIVTEVLSSEQVEVIGKYADVLQVGTRNMQNIRLLEAVGNSNLPVLLKRGMGNTIEELLLAAEYILSRGNNRIMLCERGIRTFETSTRFTFDINAIPVLKEKSHLPVIADPSHAAGKWEYVERISMAAVAAGADGIIVEVHLDPELAKSDGRQSLRPEIFKKLVNKIKQLEIIVK